jgi:hypothetical protein
VNILLIKLKKIIHTSMPNQITTFYAQTRSKRRVNVINISAATTVTSALKQISLRDKEKDFLQI